MMVNFDIRSDKLIVRKCPQFHNFKTLIIIKREARMSYKECRLPGRRNKKSTKFIQIELLPDFKNLSSRVHYLLKTFFFVNRWHMTQRRLTRNLSSELLVAISFRSECFIHEHHQRQQYWIKHDL